jgi:glucokinase
MDNRYSVGIDVGGSHVGCAVVDLRTASVVEGSMVEKPVDSAAGADEILAVWCGAVRQSVERSGVRPARAGWAFPGPFDYDRGVSKIRGVGKFERLFGLDVAGSLTARLRGTTVARHGFVNDASAFALGESLGGAARGIDNVMVLTLGTGFGSGFVSGGHIVTDPARVPENGWVYCLPFEGGIADDAFSTRWFVNRFAELTGERVNGVKEIAARGDGDPAVKKIFEEYGRRLGVFVAPVCRRFGGEAIVLGGNIARAFPLFERTMNEALASACVDAKVRQAMLPKSAAITGAASIFI